MLFICLYSIWSIRTTCNNFNFHGKTRLPKKQILDLNLRWCIVFNQLVHMHSLTSFNDIHVKKTILICTHCINSFTYIRLAVQPLWMFWAGTFATWRQLRSKKAQHAKKENHLFPIHLWKKVPFFYIKYV